VQLTGGRRSAARASFEQAVGHSPNLSRAHSSLGVMAIEDGRVEEAFDHWKRAAALDPSEYGRILRMGLAFAREGRSVAGRACLEFFAANAPPARYAADLDRVRAWLSANRPR
jgi:lipoprotein NlpI